MTQIVQNSMPMGLAGDLSRSQFSIVVESFVQFATTPVTAFGLPVKQASGAPDAVTGMTTGDAATALEGFLVRQAPSLPGTVAAEPFGTATPPVTGPVSVLKQGYILVKNNAGTPVRGGTVYVRVAAAAAGKPIGGIEAAADSTNTVALTDVVFTGAADADGIAEIRVRVGND